MRRILPVTYSTPMVIALDEGRKLMTRRLAWRLDAGRRIQWAPTIWQSLKPGDLLYVREAWRVSNRWDKTKPRELPARAMTVFFEAGGSIANQEKRGDWRADAWPERGVRPDWVGKFRQAMHHPKWASRFTLEVTAVRVERLQAISEEDAIAEGIERVPYTGSLPEYQGSYGWKDYSDHPHAIAPYRSPVRSFHSLWDSLHGAGAWDANPEVAVISFSLLRQNILAAAA